MDLNEMQSIFTIGETVAVEFKRCGNGIESEQIIFAWLDKDNQVTPLTDEQLNPVWKILNYETGKYESVQKHFRVFEV